MSSGQDNRPHKRLRTSQDSTLQPSTAQGTSFDSLKRHSEFWFDDGSVVLVAQNTGFRVFRTLLAAQSTVFADMFSSSSPDTEAMMEGCPVVHLSDSPQDVAHFLRVLLPKAQPNLFSRKVRFSFPQISAIIRLAHKYNVQAVLDQALSALEDAFPSDFDAWERIQTQTPAVKFKDEHAIAVVNLAFLVDRPSLLPAAFYRCAMLGSDILDGCTLGSGKRSRKAAFAMVAATAEREHLELVNAKRAIDGRNELASRALGVLLDVFHVGPCAECDTRDHCGPVLEMMRQWALEDEKAADADVLGSWREQIELWSWDAASVVCGECKKALIEGDVRARRRVWRELPEIFGIEEEVGYVGASEYECDVGDDD